MDDGSARQLLAFARMSTVPFALVGASSQTGSGPRVPHPDQHLAAARAVSDRRVAGVWSRTPTGAKSGANTVQRQNPPALTACLHFAKQRAFSSHLTLGVHARGTG